MLGGGAGRRVLGGGAGRKVCWVAVLVGEC